MFIDGLKIVQDFPLELIPLEYRDAFVSFDLETGEITDEYQERSHCFRYEGSHKTSVGIRVRLGRVEVDGNPSRINRYDNLFGYTRLDDCVSVFNRILTDCGLPNFSKATEVWYSQAKEGKRAHKITNGAIIQEIHLTTNRMVGEGNEADYLKGLASQKYRNSMPRLHQNGTTVDWLSKLGNSPLIYPSVYNKTNEIGLHALPKLKRQYGADSPEYSYLLKVQKYCNQNGVVRFEQKVKSEYLRRNNLNYYGLSDLGHFDTLHNEFLHIDKRLKVNNMKLEHIAERLINEGVCRSTLSANCTANYAYLWMHGAPMDLLKTQIRTHRARLRKIGIDIGIPCDITRFSPVFVKEIKEIMVSDLAIPSWYQMPETQLKLVA